VATGVTIARTGGLGFGVGAGLGAGAGLGGAAGAAGGADVGGFGAGAGVGAGVGVGAGEGFGFGAGFVVGFDGAGGDEDEAGVARRCGAVVLLTLCTTGAAGADARRPVFGAARLEAGVGPRGCATAGAATTDSAAVARGLSGTNGSTNGICAGVSAPDQSRAAPPTHAAAARTATIRRIPVPTPE